MTETNREVIHGICQDAIRRSGFGGEVTPNFAEVDTDALQYRGIWDETRSYRMNDVVYYESRKYLRWVAIRNPNPGDEPGALDDNSDSPSWEHYRWYPEKKGEPGDTRGADGYVWREEWTEDPDTPYYPNDVVLYQGQRWIARLPDGMEGIPDPLDANDMPRPDSPGWCRCIAIVYTLSSEDQYQAFGSYAGAGAYTVDIRSVVYEDLDRVDAELRSLVISNPRGGEIRSGLDFVEDSSERQSVYRRQRSVVIYPP